TIIYKSRIEEDEEKRNNFNHNLLSINTFNILIFSVLDQDLSKKSSLLSNTKHQRTTITTTTQLNTNSSTVDKSIEEALYHIDKLKEDMSDLCSDLDQLYAKRIQTNTNSSQLQTGTSPTTSSSPPPSPSILHSNLSK